MLAWDGERSQLCKTLQYYDDGKEMNGAWVDTWELSRRNEFIENCYSGFRNE